MALATAATGHGPFADGMVLIKGGTFGMGAQDKEAWPAEGPVHQVSLQSFWIDQHPVTVKEFAAFANATGYKTDSEKFGWSGAFDLRTHAWRRVEGADWRHPEGPASRASDHEPVTQVSWNDAVAYCQWKKKRLPTEAEFESAARGGLVDKKYAWGDELRPDGSYRANYWQGSFPDHDRGDDGYVGRSPVKSFPPNGYGLYDITGNVWQWCSDWFNESYFKDSPRKDPRGPSHGTERVTRGGSWLCSANYCTGYRVAARNHATPDSALNNLGFRCARNASPASRLESHRGTSLNYAEWAAFDDTREGGESSGEIKVLPGSGSGSGPSLLVSGYIEEGIDHPMAGARFSLGERRFEIVRFKAKGRTPRCQIGLLTVSNGRKPVTRQFVLHPEWTEYAFMLSDFGVVNGAEVTGILLSGGPDPGPFAFQVSDVELLRLPKPGSRKSYGF